MIASAAFSYVGVSWVIEPQGPGNFQDYDPVYINFKDIAISQYFEWAILLLMVGTNLWATGLIFIGAWYVAFDLNMIRLTDVGHHVARLPGRTDDSCNRYSSKRHLRPKQNKCSCPWSNRVQFICASGYVQSHWQYSSSQPILPTFRLDI